MPAAAEARLAEYARIWAKRGIRAWGEGWWTMPLEVGDQVARIVGAGPGTTVMHQNVAVAEAIVLSCFRPVDPRATGSSTSARTSPPCAISTRPSPTSRSSSARTTRRSSRRSTSAHCSSRSATCFSLGEIQDVEPIIRRAHEVGAHVILDCYQSAGIVPFSVAELEVDFAVGGSVKWLCGGPGNGWLYVRPDSSRGSSRRSSAGRRTSAVRFEAELRYAPGVARFLTGTPNVPALYAATAGYDLVEEIGVERIRANSLRRRSC